MIDFRKLTLDMIDTEMNKIIEEEAEQAKLRVHQRLREAIAKMVVKLDHETDMRMNEQMITLTINLNQFDAMKY